MAPGRASPLAHGRLGCKPASGATRRAQTTRPRRHGDHDGRGRAFTQTTSGWPAAWASSLAATPARTPREGSSELPRVARDPRGTLRRRRNAAGVASATWVMKPPPGRAGCASSGPAWRWGERQRPALRGGNVSHAGGRIQLAGWTRAQHGRCPHPERRRGRMGTGPSLKAPRRTAQADRLAGRWRQVSRGPPKPSPGSSPITRLLRSQDRGPIPRAWLAPTAAAGIGHGHTRRGLKAPGRADA